MTTDDRERRPWPLVGWLLALGLVVWQLGRIGEGALGGPPVGDLQALATWYADRAPPELLFAAVRLVALAIGWYLLAATVVGMAARLLRAARLVTIVDAVTLPAVRRTLQAAMGVGLAAATVTSLPLAHAQGWQTATAQAEEQIGHGESAPVLTGAPQVTSADADAAPRLRSLAPDPHLVQGLPIEAPERLPDPASGPATATEDAQPLLEGESGDPQVDEEAGAPNAGREDVSEVAGATRHTIQAGEHLWSIAEQTLAAAWDQAPTDAEIVPYWRELIEHNRGDLPDPANPDLVHPGMSLALPEISPP